MSTSQLRQANIAFIPEQGTTSLANVRRAAQRSRGFIRRNYPGVVEVGIGKGWGIYYTLDQYGDKSFHHSRDHMVAVALGKRSECPGPDTGTLFVFGNDDVRVPVRFLYRHSG